MHLLVNAWYQPSTGSEIWQLSPRLHQRVRAGNAVPVFSPKEFSGRRVKGRLVDVLPALIRCLGCHAISQVTAEASRCQPSGALTEATYVGGLDLIPEEMRAWKAPRGPVVFA
jgi:hypothetical protein